jgi:hypothetical protein
MSVQHKQRIVRLPPRKANALLVCLFVMTLASLSLLGVLNSLTSQMAARRNTVDYERALYLAGAGAHAALAELEADSSWLTGISSTSFGGGTYSATVTDQGNGTRLVTGTGVSGSVTRKVQVTIQFGP